MVMITPTWASLEAGDILMVDFLHTVYVVRKSSLFVPTDPGLVLWVAHKGRLDGFTLYSDGFTDGREPTWYRRDSKNGPFERVPVSLLSRAYRPPRKEILAELGDSDEVADWVGVLLHD